MIDTLLHFVISYSNVALIRLPAETTAACRKPLSVPCGSTLAGPSGGRSYIVRVANAQIRAERGTDDVSNLCSFRKASAARSPMMMQGAMVLPVVTRGMIEPSAIRRFSIP
jgi:hypothetical protein